MSEKNKFLLTVTILCPHNCAPKHSPVDIAPQPEYKSNAVLLDSSILQTSVGFSSTSLVMLMSLETAADASMSASKISDQLNTVVHIIYL